MLGQWFGGSLPVGWVHSCPNNTLRTVMTGTFRRNWDSSMRTGVYGMVSPDPKGHGRGNSLHGKAAQNEEAFYGIEEASTSALQQGNVIVEGTIQKVQYRSSESGYSVLKVGISP